MPVPRESSNGAARATAAVPACPCGVPARQPWRDREAVLSKAPFGIGLLVWAIAIAVAIGSVRGRWIVLAVLAGLVAVLLGSFGVQRGKGHRRWCWLARSLWLGIASIGLPTQLLSVLNF